jgi:MFS family permease
VACEIETAECIAATGVCIAPSPVSPKRQSETRRNLRISVADGLACSIMIGIGETYLPAFALALGTGQVLAGLIASVPIFAGAMLQLISPAAIRWLGSNRRWVIGCVTVQAISFLPMLAAALVGHISTALLFLLAAVYWASGMASTPAWNHWIDTLVPQRIRARYMGRRSRFLQAGILAGFVGGGLALEFGETLGRPLWAFAMLFLVASICRFISAGFLLAQSEPVHVGAQGSIAGLRGACRRLRKDREGRLLVYLWALQMAAQTAGPFYAPFMLGLLKFSYLKYMLIVSAALITKAVALPTLGKVAHRFGARRLLTFGGIAVIPLSTLWILSQGTTYLLSVQVISGVCWAAYELATLLMFFEAVERRQRIGMLTLYNIGYAAATVAGALCGGAVLAFVGEPGGYFAVFGLSAIARFATMPLLLRIGAAAPPIIADTISDAPAETAAAEFADEEVDLAAPPQVIEMIPPFAAVEDLSGSQVA